MFGHFSVLWIMKERVNISNLIPNFQQAKLDQSRKTIFVWHTTKFRFFWKFVGWRPSLESQIAACWDDRVYRRMNLAYILMIGKTVVNGRFNIIGTSKYWGPLIKFFDKLSKNSRKGSLDLEKVENCTTLACIVLIEATR